MSEVATGVTTQGWDISLNHGAVVQLKDGELDNWWYYTDQAGSAARSTEHGARVPINSKADRHTMAMERLAWIERWLDKTILVPTQPQFVGVEDYALRAEQGAHQMGEVGGIARILLWFRGVHFRLHDPISVKMFATHDGTAQKDGVEQAVAERWGWQFDAYNQPPPAKGKPNRRTSEDLADAFAIAMLVWIEWQLRNGLTMLSDLATKEIQVFNRTTKTYPTSLLGREWIHNPNGRNTPQARFQSCSSEQCGLQILDERGLLKPPLRANLIESLSAPKT